MIAQLNLFTFGFLFVEFAVVNIAKAAGREHHPDLRSPWRCLLPRQPLNQCIAMEMLGLDIGHFAGTKYLICVDRYSGYQLVGKLGKSSST